MNVLSESGDTRIPNAWDKMAEKAGCSAWGPEHGEKLNRKPWRERGDQNVQGNIHELAFTRATRHHSGVYTCSAANGSPAPAEAEIVLDVQVCGTWHLQDWHEKLYLVIFFQHKPEIEMDKERKKDGVMEITCIVQASPSAKVCVRAPIIIVLINIFYYLLQLSLSCSTTMQSFSSSPIQVSWYKNGELLPPNKIVVERVGNRHSLLIEQVDLPKHPKKQMASLNFGIFLGW